MGFAPNSEGVTLRTFNRNFEGRSGTRSGRVYLVSPETAVASAISGVITDPRSLGRPVEVKMPKKYKINDSMIIPPDPDGSNVELIRGPNIKPAPIGKDLSANMEGKVLLKMEDNITTDHIIPGGARILPLRSNIPEISKHLFTQVDSSFYDRTNSSKGGILIGGSNYGQGSSREHAALGPMFMGIKAVITKSFARIHKANLINFGIIPLTFENEKDYDSISLDDVLKIENTRDQIKAGTKIKVKNTTKNSEFTAVHDLTNRQMELIFDGGLLNNTKKKVI
jgi:aconitate hydratase